MANRTPTPPAPRGTDPFGEFDRQVEAVERYLSDVIGVQRAVMRGGFQLVLLTAGDPAASDTILPTPEREYELRDAALAAVSQLGVNLLLPPDPDRQLSYEVTVFGYMIERRVTALPRDFDPADQWKLLRPKCDARLIVNHLLPSTRISSPPAPAGRKPGGQSLTPQERKRNISLYTECDESGLTKEEFVRGREMDLAYGLKLIESGRKLVYRDKVKADAQANPSGRKRTAANPTGRK